MGDYTIDQWVLFFFFYCLCGWVWESCYVSLCQHHWVNRGFLHGPLLPIYGSGALIILLSTLRVQESLPLIFLFGMIAATVLEYVTGAVMERLFKVRYWDYSKQKLNLNGYICLSSTLAWGVFSILLVKLIHPPIKDMLMRIPQTWAEPIAFVLVSVTTVDAVISVRAALDLKEILTKLTEENETLRRLAKRAEVVSTFAEEDLRAFRERTELEKVLLQDRLEAELGKQKELQTQRKRKRREAQEEALQRRTAARVHTWENVAEALRAARAKLESSESLTGEEKAKRREEIDGTLEKIRLHQARLWARNTRSYQHSLRILRGNPSAKAKEYAEAMENLRRAGGMHRD